MFIHYNRVPIHFGYFVLSLGPLSGYVYTRLRSSLPLFPTNRCAISVCENLEILFYIFL